MKNKMKLWAIYAISLLPISSISLAATSKFYSLKDRESLLKLRSGDPIKLKSMIWSPLKLSVSYEDAYANFLKRSPLVDEDQNAQEFERILVILAEEGLVKLNENDIVSPAPSQSS